MAIYTKAEFAKECQMSPTALRQYIKRLKVVVNFDNKLDSEDLQNKEFLEKHRQKKVKDQRPEPHVEKDENIQYTRGKKTKQIEVEGEQTEVIEGELSLFTDDELKQMPSWMLEKIQRVVFIQKGLEERDLLKIKKDKIHGIVIPTEMVKNLFAQHNKSVLIEFNNAVDIIVTKFSKKMKLNNTEQTSIRRDLIYEINSAVNKAVDQTKKDLKTIITMSTESRGKGERK